MSGSGSICHLDDKESQEDLTSCRETVLDIDMELLGYGSVPVICVDSSTSKGGDCCKLETECCGTHVNICERNVPVNKTEALAHDKSIGHQLASGAGHNSPAAHRTQFLSHRCCEAFFKLPDEVWNSLMTPC